MEELIFVDSGAWIARVVPNDRNHVLATDWLDSNTGTLVTSDYVIDETLTWLRVRRENQRAVVLGHELLEGSDVIVHKIDSSDLQATWQLFNEFADKRWSFTDCSSKIVMDRLRINTAFAFDQHFRQFGNVEVVP